MNKINLLTLSFFLALTGAVGAQDATTPVAQSTVATLAPTPAGSDFVPASISGQNPSQAESDKAPATNKPAAVPKFSLPDVVITGENELTIGAKRTESLENDVTLGAENLTQLNRSADDLPGLNKSLTALSTQETGTSQDTALILHGGGGIPGTLGGWGLFGQDMTTVQYLLSAYYSTWGGEATNGSFDGDQKYGFGGEFKLMPTDKLDLRLSLYMDQVDATLPYENALQETHRGWNPSVNLGYKWSNVWRTELVLDGKIADLTLGYPAGANNDQAQEYKEKIRLVGEEIDPFWSSLVLEAGDLQSSSNFPSTNYKSTINSSYNLAWASAQTRFDFTENLDLTASVEGQSGSYAFLSSKLFPAVDLRWRLLEDTQLTAYWKTGRTQYGFYDTYLDREHVSPQSGLPTATENTGEWGASLTEKFDQYILLNLTASTAQLQNYQQWTDVNATDDLYLETYSSVPTIQLNRFTADLQWKWNDVWKTDWFYQWTQGLNQSGDGLNLTFLPTNQGSFSITRADDQWEATLSVVLASDRQGLDSGSLDLPAYATLNLSAAYHISRGFSLWLNGDNLLGASYDLQPGYLEPQVHLRGGIEIVF